MGYYSGVYFEEPAHLYKQFFHFINGLRQTTDHNTIAILDHEITQANHAYTIPNDPTDNGGSRKVKIFDTAIAHF